MALDFSLSDGEVLEVNITTFCLALWPQSGTTGNLIRSAPGAITFIHRQAASTLLSRIVRLSDLNDFLAVSVFDGRVTETRLHQASCDVLQGGVAFNLPDRAHVLTRRNFTTERLRTRSLTGAFTHEGTLGDQMLQRPIIPSSNDGK